jgi:hypothetical protein
MDLWSRIFRPERARSELAEEIEAHLALAAADKREGGAEPETARREAEREFGNAALVKDVVRRMWGWVWLDSLEQDLTSALRQLRRAPQFSKTVVATLALGIGAAAAMEHLASIAARRTSMCERGNSRTRRSMRSLITLRGLNKIFWRAIPGP